MRAFPGKVEPGFPSENAAKQRVERFRHSKKSENALTCGNRCGRSAIGEINPRHRQNSAGNHGGCQRFAE